MVDSDILRLFANCLAHPLDSSIRSFLADRLEQTEWAPLVGALRQSLGSTQPIPISSRIRPPHRPVEWAFDGWFGLDLGPRDSLEETASQVLSPLIGALRINAWDEVSKSRFRTWKPDFSPSRVSFLPGGTISPHLSEILSWKWLHRISYLDLRSTFPGNAGIQAFKKRSNALSIKALDLRRNLLSPNSVGGLLDWPGLANLELLDLRENSGTSQEWKDLLKGKPFQSIPRVLCD